MIISSSMSLEKPRNWTSREMRRMELCCMSPHSVFDLQPSINRARDRILSIHRTPSTSKHPQASPSTSKPNHSTKTFTRNQLFESFVIQWAFCYCLRRPPPPVRAIASRGIQASWPATPTTFSSKKRLFVGCARHISIGSANTPPPAWVKTYECPLSQEARH